MAGYWSVKMRKYPDISVKLVGRDGNAFYILGQVERAMKKHNVPEEEIQQFMNEAMSGDYNKLLRTCMAWVDVK